MAVIIQWKKWELLKCYLYLMFAIVLLVVVYKMGRPSLGVHRSPLEKPHQRPITDRINTNHTKVIILSYMRSGTSVVGKLFDTNDEALYVYEPLWYVCTVAVPRYIGLNYLNGTKRYAPESCKLVGLDIMESFLNCDIEKIDTETLSSVWHLEQGRKTRAIVECGLRWGCMQDFIKRCKNTLIRSVKTIRLRLKDIQPLLEKYPELKVIHLVRDPRGIIQSRIQIKEYYSKHPLLTAAEICGNMHRDAESFKQLRVFFPGRVFQLRYEDFAAEPLLYAERVYRFLNLSLPRSTVEWIKTNTRGNKRETGTFGTSRDDSMRVAYRWRSLISWDLASRMSGPCRSAYDAFLYATVNSETELRDYNYTLRLEMCQNKDVVQVCPKH